MNENGSTAVAVPLVAGPASTPAIKIDSGVPIPARVRGHRGTWSKYPWRTLKIGDSFVFPTVKTLRETQSRANALTAGRKANHGETYTTRTVIENDVRVVRIWRTA